MLRLSWRTRVPGGHRLTYATDMKPERLLYAQDVPDGPRRVLGPLGAIPLADGGAVELDGPGRRLVFRAAGTERAVAVPDSLGSFVKLWAGDADGGGVYLLVNRAAAGAPSHTGIVWVDRASGALTTVIDLPLAQVPYALAAEHGTVTYATWPQGRNSRPTIWRAGRGRPAGKVAELPLTCTEGSLRMAADGRRFACAEWTARPDLFLLEHFDRYRR